ATGDSAVEGPTTNEEGDTSGSARSGKNSAGATGNPNTKPAKTRTRSSQDNQFGSLDANGDNKISQDELKVSAT
ncbi:MAG TPA: EF-hand domain-containing protein, partial [Planctomycetota bacterium]